MLRLAVFLLCPMRQLLLHHYITFSFLSHISTIVNIPIFLVPKGILIHALKKLSTQLHREKNSWNIPGLLSQGNRSRVRSSISSDLTWPKTRALPPSQNGRDVHLWANLSSAFLTADKLELAAGLSALLQRIGVKWTQKWQEQSKNMERLLHNKWLHRLQLLRLENMQII